MAEGSVVPATGRPRAEAGAAARWLPWLLVLLVLVAAVPAIVAMPPIDRDETRFAQATRQMLETGDYVAIYFQDEPRNKKPVGIHWLQAASVGLFSSPKAAEIWAYRIPSLAGAVGAVLVLLLLGRRLFGERVGALAALLMAGCLAVQVEALMAKTDAVLLLTILTAQLALAEIWQRSQRDGPESWAGAEWRALFWVMLAAGVLIKGPLAPLVVGATILALSIVEHRWRWLGRLSPLWGLPLFLALVLPWFLFVTFLRDTGFVGEAASKDLVAKIVGGEESHGMPPGFYLGAHLLFFFPGALFALPAVLAAWRRRKQEAPLRFCLAWLLPTWIFFEVMPTKLPHYVLPTYPALALLTAWAVTTALPELRRRWVYGLHGLIGLGALGLAAAAIALPILAEAGFLWQSVVVAVILVVGVGGTLGLAWQGRQQPALIWGAVAGALFFGWTTSAVLPRLDKVFPAEILVAEWRRLQPSDEPPLASTGFHEPSLVFLAGTETKLINPAGSARYLKEQPTAIAMVADRQLKRFLRASFHELMLPIPLAQLRIFNYSNGIWEQITYFGRSLR
ncbi:MAG TPA: glycosyltransferase family 39 protein [Kiloniellales bacterium]|nr:glycosyltransferase family 39 protein [Kiloniellales bacterium]